MTRYGNDFYFKVHNNKVGFTAKYLKKIFAITIWLSKRYKLDASSADYNMGVTGTDFADNKLTIKIAFNEEK